jgi:outer membrane protein
MKKLFIIFYISLILISNIFSDAKIDKIAVINLEEVITTVFAGNSGVIQEIKKEKENLQYKLNKMKENIMRLEAMKLKTNDSNLKISYEKKISEFEKEYSDYYKLKSYELQKKINNLEGSLFKEIRDKVKKIAETEGYSMVLDAKSEAIFYYTSEIDITEKVIEYFKQTYGDEKETE